MTTTSEPRSSTRRTRLGLGLLLVGAILAAMVWRAVGPSLGLRQSSAQESTGTLQALLTWDGLTPAQSEALRLKLRDQPKQPVRINCRNNDHCRRLADDLRRLFVELGWPVDAETPVLSARPPLGLVVGPLPRPEVRILKDAIETATGIPTAQSVYAIDVGQPLTLSILARPLPDLLPVEVSEPLLELTLRLRGLSGQILEFAQTRTREMEPLLIRPDPDKEKARILQLMEFRKNTETVYREKFGAQAESYVAELADLGIALPEIIVDRRSEPARLAAFFLTMADYLEQGRVNEARRVASDQALWFR